MVSKISIYFIKVNNLKMKERNRKYAYVISKQQIENTWV